MTIELKYLECAGQKGCRTEASRSGGCSKDTGRYSNS